MSEQQSVDNCDSGDSKYVQRYALTPDTEWWRVGTDYVQGHTPIYSGYSEEDHFFKDDVVVLIGHQVWGEEAVKRLRDFADFLESHPDFLY